MRKYVISHWRGEHHIMWLVLVNGVMVYLVLLAIFAALISPYAWRSAAKGPVAPYWLVPVVAVMVWSGVGIVRGAMRTITDRHQRWISRAFAIASAALVGLADIALANDIRYFVSIWMTD